VRAIGIACGVPSSSLAIPLDSRLVGNIARNRVQVLHYIMIRHSKHTVALIGKILRSRRIRKELVFVTGPVQLNDQPQLSATEIDYELTDGLLPSKFQTT
jgi:hypothetical protein